MLTRVILATAAGVVGAGTAVATGTGVAVGCEIGLAPGDRVVAVGATVGPVAAGTAVGAGAAVATALGVAVASLPQATIIAAIPTMSHKGLNSNRFNWFDFFM